MSDLDALKKMREDFLPNQISKMCRSTKKDNPKGNCPKCKGWHGLPAIQLDYVGHAALTDRLLDADPQWTWEPIAFDAQGYPAIDKDGGMWIKLTVGGVTRYGYGDAQGKTGGDAMKERIGDALRNAAMRFGAALDLWHKGDLHVDEDNRPENLIDEGQGERKTSTKKDGNKTTATTTKEQATEDQRVKIIELCTAIADMTTVPVEEVLKDVSMFEGSNGPIWLTMETLASKCTKGWAGRIITKAEEKYIAATDGEPF